MNIFKRYTEFTKLIGQDHRRIVELERIIIDLTDKMFRIEKRIDAIEKKQAKRYPHLIDRLDKLEEVEQSKDTYIDNVIKQHNIK
jgi:hypothetical protein|tara:strand:- start:102 stop:356 length:255 start_codon:yes stop_codon:yes gene_type:complete